MLNERKAEILDQLIDWICMHEDEFIQCAIDATDLTDNEKEELCFTTGEDEDEDCEEEELTLEEEEGQEYYDNVCAPQIETLNKGARIL